MASRWHQSMFLIALVLSQNFCSHARQLPPQKQIRSGHQNLQQQQQDKQSTSSLRDDPFSWTNLLSMGVKVALAVISSYATDDIDRVDKVSPTQAILGTIISAVTGSENPEEVMTMAKQGADVIALLMDLVASLGTSLTS